MNTFAHIPSIGPKAEEALWGSGIYDWDRFENTKSIKLSEKKITLIEKYIQESKEQIKDKNPKYFESNLNSKLRKTPFHKSLQIIEPSAPTIPFEPDLKVIEKIKRAYY